MNYLMIVCQAPIYNVLWWLEVHNIYRVSNYVNEDEAYKVLEQIISRAMTAMMGLEISS